VIDEVVGVPPRMERVGLGWAHRCAGSAPGWSLRKSL
jgi:hypothetical protein